MSDPSPSVSELRVAPEPVSPRPAISVEHLSASYRVRRRPPSAWRGLADMLRRDGSSLRLVPALRDVSFTVPKGTVLGVIGRNGAGKSTLLRTIAGILPPTEGRVVVRGRISSLLAPGAGFNVQLTGRENIELGGLTIGLPEDRLDELSQSIAEFAQLGEYLDLPVQGYSSGMRMRLGFAIAVHLDPEILLVDEALAGGDAKFKERSGAKMHELCGAGRTIVIVSHGLRAIRFMASTAMWLHQGRIVEFGDPDDVVNSYMRYSRLKRSDEAWEDL
jgi:teichoic acid transport system ATP-binding protein